MIDLTDILPKEQTSKAVHAAIVQLWERRQAIAQQLGELRETRAVALLDLSVTPPEITEIETKMRELGIVLERINDIEPKLQTQLTEAEQAENLTTVEQQIAEANRLVADYRKDLRENYPELASQLVALCKAGEAAMAAAQSAQAAAQRLGMLGHFDLPPGIATSAGTLPFSRTVALPNLQGGMLWGRLPEPSNRGPYRY